MRSWILLLVSLVGLKAQTAFVPTTVLCPAGQLTIAVQNSVVNTYSLISFVCAAPDSTVTINKTVTPWTMTATSTAPPVQGPGDPVALIIPNGGFFLCNGPQCQVEYNLMQFTYALNPPTGPGQCPNLNSMGTPPVATSQASGAFAVDINGYLYFCGPQISTNGVLGPPPQWMRTTVPMVTTWTP
jgi:hypothetical protein